MIRLCKFVKGRSFLQPRILRGSSNQAGVKQSIEEKLGLPVKPKKPLSPYFRFLAKVRPALKEKFPEAKMIEVTQMAGEHWAKADPEVRRQLEREFLQEKDVFNQQMEEYNRSLTAEQKQQIVDSKTEMKARKERLELKKKSKEMGKPKRPLTAFMAFLVEKIPSRREEPYREFLANVAKNWEKLDEKSKDMYRKNQEREMEVYKQELHEWESKMIRLGHIDIIRNEALIETPPTSSSSSSSSTSDRRRRTKEK